MSRPLRTLLVFCVAALVVAGLAAQPAMAKKKEACWKTLIDDWYDGVIHDKYPLACYRQALKHIPTDVETYSTAREDINRAYQARIIEIRKSRNKPKDTKPPNNPSTGDKQQEIPVVPPANPQPPPNPGNEVSTPTPPSPPRSPVPPATDPPGPATGGTQKPVKSNESAPPVVRLPPSPQAPATSPGRDNDRGPIGNAISAVGPADADSLPIPLLVLGGLAILLMVGGTLGFVNRRVQSRRLPPMRPATAPAETRRR